MSVLLCQSACDVSEHMRAHASTCEHQGATNESALARALPRSHARSRTLNANASLVRTQPCTCPFSRVGAP